MPSLRLAALGLLVLALAACGGRQTTTSNAPLSQAEQRDRQGGSIFGGEGGIQILGPNRGRSDDEGGSGIGVNSFLWRASLDTISFMPLVSADPFGGTIITDWYSPPDQPGERFKVNVFILGRQLRSDGVRVSVFRQVRDGAGGWRDVETASGTGTQLENAILSRAREFRTASAAASRS
jgi:hypothetical protein